MRRQVSYRWVAGMLEADLRFETLKIFRVFLTSTGQNFYAYQLAKQAGVARTTAGDVLRRLQSKGLLTQCDDNGGCIAGPARSTYATTPELLQEARRALEQLQIGTIVASS